MRSVSHIFHGHKLLPLLFKCPQLSLLDITCFRKFIQKVLSRKLNSRMAADSNMAPEEKPSTTPVKRAVHKIRTASLVFSLARGWQQWASDRNLKQAQEPPGWVPSAGDVSAQPVQERHFEKWPAPSTKRDQRKDDEKPSANASVTTGDAENKSRESDEALNKVNIKSKEVLKTVVSKAYERASDVSLLSGRYENNDSSSETINFKEVSRGSCAGATCMQVMGMQTGRKEGRS